jgi:hypothetical protein
VRGEADLNAIPHRVRSESDLNAIPRRVRSENVVGYLNATPSPGARRESTSVDMVALGVLSVVVSGGYILSLVPSLRWIVSRNASLGLEQSSWIWDKSS